MKTEAVTANISSPAISAHDHLCPEKQAVAAKTDGVTTVLRADVLHEREAAEAQGDTEKWLSRSDESTRTLRGQVNELLDRAAQAAPAPHSSHAAAIRPARYRERGFISGWWPLRPGPVVVSVAGRARQN